MTAPKSTPAASLTMVVGAMLAAIPMITLAMWFVLATDGIGDFPRGWAPIPIGAVLALPLVAWEAWPGRRNQLRFAAALESAGHPSYLLGRPQEY
ncbi:hypothetical protein F1D05_35315 [Kribbella qitaiheensis]|uniref:Uncharacterized protein n=1 Tax=Kribbella qitaiheensis TaxID=1544730 RepID=A0A7G6X7K0_9ACTN|nr:hypothetical protein [Kribbella qitaiheensis]QNE22215.1 hypothetical protein F1D05_35315 [Kribbella qitaiheensis]